MREGLLLHSGLVVTHQLLERLVQAGGGQAADCLRFAVGDEHPDEGSRRWRKIPGSWCSFPAELPFCCENAVCMGIKMHGADASC